MMRGSSLTTFGAAAAAFGITFAPSLIGAAAGGERVIIEVTGEVEFNKIPTGPLAEIEPGDNATMTFVVDSDVFTDSDDFPVRGYDIDHPSFEFDLGKVRLGLQNPFPSGLTPYFVIRNNDPKVDGFWLSHILETPVGIPLDEKGRIDQFAAQFAATYEVDTVQSLDILDAVGTYDFKGLTVFHFAISDGPLEPLGLIFERMVIVSCRADLNMSGDVDFPDLLAVLTAYGECDKDCPEDLDDSGDVGFTDVLILLAAWGPCVPDP